MARTPHTALVTGANSGLGFEAAAQLAEAGYSRVVLACRTIDKARTAREQLTERTGRDVFEPLAVDMSRDETVRTAVATLAEGGAIDFLLLNAGLLSGSEVVRSAAGVEITVAASLTGHHVLTMGLLNEGLLADDARIVLAGSEAARGDVPMMGLTDLGEFAAAHHDGDRTQAILTIARGEAPYVYKNSSHYAMTKLFSAWWTAALARRLPEGITVNVVSPGSAPATGAARNQPWIMKFFMSTVMGWVGPLFGMAGSVATGARRYLDAAGYGPEINGRFYASPAGKLVGAVVEQTQPHVLDRASQEACWEAVVQLTDGATLASASLREVG